MVWNSYFAQAEQFRFIEELNNYLTDQSELTTLIIGSDWNCTLTKKDKKGGMWGEKGESPTKYFFNLEKTNCSRKVISELEDDEGEITKEEEQILLKIETHYRDLYRDLKMDVTKECYENLLRDLKHSRNLL